MHAGMRSLLRSRLPGLIWPGIPDAAAALSAAAQFQLDHTQWYSGHRLGALQRLQIGTLLSHCRAHVPFYRELLESWRPEPDGSVTEDDFRRLPIVDRHCVQAQLNRLRAEQLPPMHEPVQEGWTSGSTGSPVRFLSTEPIRFFWHAMLLREHLWQGRDMSAAAAVIRVDAQAHGANWGGAAHQLFQTGSMHGCDIRVSPGEQLEWLNQVAPATLLVYPSVLRELLRHPASRRPDSLVELRCFGEVVDTSLRREALERWGLRITDSYSSREIGYIGLQCPEYEHFHVMSEVVRVEVLDADGSPCAPGQIGQVVVTQLHNFAQPFIRYAIGDFAQVGDACPCGRGLPVLHRVTGRSRNCIVRPDGARIFPSLVFNSLVRQLRQFQLVQHARDDFELRYVASEAFDARMQDEARGVLRRGLGFDVPVRFSRVDAIARGPGGKFEDVICLL